MLKQQRVKLLYEFERGDDCCHNTDHRYIMQLSREIRSINIRQVYKSSFENLGDELTIEGKNEKQKQSNIRIWKSYSNIRMECEYSNNLIFVDILNIYASNITSIHCVHVCVVIRVYCDARFIGNTYFFILCLDLKEGASSLARNLWKELFSMYELVDIMRQKDDLAFAQLLNRLRLNEMTEEDKQKLQTRVFDRDTGDYPKDAVHLFAENVYVKKHIDNILSQLPGEKVVIPCHDHVVSANIPAKECQRLINSLPDDYTKTGQLMKSLTVVVGMIVVHTINVDVDDGLTNGAYILTSEWKEQIVQALLGFCLMSLELVGQHERNTENYTTQAFIQIRHLYLIHKRHLY